MRVVVTGGTGVIGRRAVRAMRHCGHAVSVVCRSAANRRLVAELDAEPVMANIFNADDLAVAFDGADVVANLATHIPIGSLGAWPPAWRLNDKIRSEASLAVATAAQRAGVSRMIQESTSFVYADGGDAWITEESPLDITQGTNPMVDAEAAAQSFDGCAREAVILRFGAIVGNDRNTKSLVKNARRGRPVGMGSPDAWSHLVHTDDLGAAVVHALDAPSGIYNVGAEPIANADYVSGYADALGLDRARFIPEVLTKMAGPRVELITRSHRVSSDLFTTSSGWQPRRPSFDPSWLDAAQATRSARSGG